MTDYDYDVVRAQLVDDVKAVLADTEELLDALRTDSKERVAGLRPRVEAALKRARARVAEAEATVTARARQVVLHANAYAHENPWRTAGMAAAGGALLGAIVGVLLARR
jgi:ElaB/YqjD/DUF883 family membrane-anchored ribosome-binding protein